MESLVAIFLKSLALYVTTRVVWPCFRRLVLKHPFDALPGPESDSFFTGNFDDFFDKEHGSAYHEGIIAKYGSMMRIHGTLGSKMLLVSDPQALHHIFVKDQGTFQLPRNFQISNGLIFGNGLLATIGDHHKKQRKLVNPAFSTGHLRNMVPIFIGVANRLRDTLTRVATKGPTEVEFLHWVTRSALEIIGQSSFGYSFDQLTEDYKEHPYAKSVKMLTTEQINNILLIIFVFPIVRRWNLGGKRLQRFFADNLTFGAPRRLRDIIDIMHSTSVEIFQLKQRALAEGDDVVSSRIAKGRDVLSILMRANMEADSEEDKLPNDELLAQISTFTFGAMDTTSGVLSRLFYMLAKIQDAQDRVRKEVQEAKAEHGDGISYEVLTELPYLDSLCRETLRLWPSIPLLSRDVSQSTTLPLSIPVIGKSGEAIKEVVVPKGTTVWTSLLGANRLPEIWGPDAAEWKPERWLSPLPETVLKAKMPGIYSHQMTFLGGGRACPGYKFAQLEMKAIVYTLIPVLRFTLIEGKDIKWTSNGIPMPTTDLTKAQLELPLLVERLA
ncbi:cytochrome P450 [Coprinopsis cinerea AmutBmut pab1-1]|nr:cytochrome P450 [Coprinopsis cinerea AmutBmut pab1-1]